MRSTMLVLLVVVAGTVAPAAGGVEVTDLGRIHSFDLGGVEYRLSLNNDGQVAGTCPYVAASASGFAWEDGSTYYFSVGFGIPGSHTYNINGSGVIAGAYGDTPAIWERKEIERLGLVDWEKTDLPTLSGKSTGAACGINTAGNVVGCLFNNASPFSPAPGFVPTAVLWTSSGVSELGKLYESDAYSSAVDIDDSGRVIGYSGDYAFLLEGGQWHDPGALTGDTITRARAMNNQRQIVGCSFNDAGQCHAFIWENGAIAGLPETAGIESWVSDISDSGEAVGGYQSNDGKRACLWKNDALIDLTDLAAETGWILREAHAINADGWIVGYGTNPAGEHYRGFLMEPVPEPASLLLIALGGVFVRRRLTRRRG